MAVRDIKLWTRSRENQGRDTWITWSRETFPRKTVFRENFSWRKEKTNKLVTKENPTWRREFAVLRRIINLFWCQRYNEYVIYGMIYLIKHICARLVGICVQKSGFGGCRTVKWRVLVRPLTRYRSVTNKSKTPKGKLRPKSCCFPKLVFLLVFCSCYCLSYLLISWSSLCCAFINLYSGKFKFLSLARARRCFEQQGSETDVCQGF